MDVHSYMQDWAVNYIKNKDAFTKKIEHVEKNKNGFDLHVKYRDREQFVIVLPSLKSLDSAISKLNNDSQFLIVTLNSNENFKLLIEKWKRLIEFKFLSMIFANPFSHTDKRWIVAPWTHHRICDEKSLELGLRAMYDMVEPIGEQEILLRIKG